MTLFLSPSIFHSPSPLQSSTLPLPFNLPLALATSIFHSPSPLQSSTFPLPFNLPLALSTRPRHSPRLRSWAKAPDLPKAWKPVFITGFHSNLLSKVCSNTLRIFAQPVQLLFCAHRRTYIQMDPHHKYKDDPPQTLPHSLVQSDSSCSKPRPLPHPLCTRNSSSDGPISASPACSPSSSLNHGGTAPVWTLPRATRVGATAHYNTWKEWAENGRPYTQ